MPPDLSDPPGSRRPPAARRRLAPAVAAGLLAALLGGGAALAAAGVLPLGTGAQSVPDVRLVDDDGGLPLFRVDGMRPGDAVTRCITIANQGRLDARIALGGTVAGSGLAPYLGVVVERGPALAGVPLGSCAGFVPSGPPVFSGPLSALPADPQAGARDPAAVASNGRAAYRITAMLADDNGAQGKVASVAFTFAGEGIPGTGQPTVATTPSGPVPAGTACATISLGPRTVRRITARTRTVRGTLVLRRAPGRAGARLRLTAAVRVRGAAVPQRRWTQARWTVRGRRAGTARRRPFAATVAAGRFRVGVTTVQVVVSRRGGGPVRARFRVRVKAVRTAGRVACLAS